MNGLNFSLSPEFRRQNLFYKNNVELILSNAMRYPLTGALVIELPSGKELTLDKNIKGPKARISLKNESTLLQFLTGGSIGLANSYLKSEWNTPNLSLLLEWCSRNESNVAPLLSKPLFARLAARIAHLSKPNSIRGSRINIAAHYDLGNEFYSQWLDSSMTYSAGHFSASVSSLEEAQIAKFNYIAKSLDLMEHSHLLDIGGGWGGFACHVAKHIGCQVTVTTISREQYNYALEKVARAKLTGLVHVIYSDYRRLTGRFDRISSIEMFEAVGEAYWSTFARALMRLLSPNGRIFLQTIVIRDDLFAKYRRNVDFIQKYIFPGGMLPSHQALQRLFAPPEWTWMTLPLSDVDYGQTLAQWRTRFETSWPQIKYHGFDHNFFRLWQYYLAYCEAGFRSGRINITQSLIGR